MFPVSVDPDPPPPPLEHPANGNSAPKVKSAMSIPVSRRRRQARPARSRKSSAAVSEVPWDPNGDLRAPRVPAEVVMFKVDDIFVASVSVAGVKLQLDWAGRPVVQERLTIPVGTTAPETDKVSGVLPVAPAVTLIGDTAPKCKSAAFPET